jgi:integrase/recombinase XerD
MVGFSQFIRERQYLTNVSPSTLEWYKHSFKWLRTEAPAQDELKDAVLRMREKGLKADTGCRITEALTLHVRDIDLDNLLITLDGKGRKQRVVPFSFELRKVLYRFVADQNRKPDLLLLASRNETRLGRRVMLRDVKLLCKRLGFDPPARTLHATRHTFAVNYLRCGGSVFHLQKVLGHSSLEMTRRYCNMITQDLQAVHERVSMLSRS